MVASPPELRHSGGAPLTRRASENRLRGRCPGPCTPGIRDARKTDRVTTGTARSRATVIRVPASLARGVTSSRVTSSRVTEQPSHGQLSHASENRAVTHRGRLHGVRRLVTRLGLFV